MKETDKIIKEKSSRCLSIACYDFHSSRRYQRFINEQGVFVKSGCHDKYLAEVQHSSAQLRLITRQPCYVPAALIYASYLVLHHVQDPSIVSYDTRNCRKSQKLRKPRCITITRFNLTIPCYDKGKYKRANMHRVFINQLLLSIKKLSPSTSCDGIHDKDHAEHFCAFSMFIDMEVTFPCQ